MLGGAALVALATEDEDLRALLAFPAATTLLAASAGILSAGALPRAVGYAGLVATALQLFAALSLDELAIAAFAAWALLASAAMLTRRGG